eukprot:12391560-Alexandrium_andersonii.AAC.1
MPPDRDAGVSGPLRSVMAERLPLRRGQSQTPSSGTSTSSATCLGRSVHERGSPVNIAFVPNFPVMLLADSFDSTSEI